MPGQLGTETYKLIIERAKDLLTNLHLKVMESGLEMDQNEDQAMVVYGENKTCKKFWK